MAKALTKIGPHFRPKTKTSQLAGFPSGWLIEETRRSPLVNWGLETKQGLVWGRTDVEVRFLPAQGFHISTGAISN